MSRLLIRALGQTQAARSRSLSTGILKHNQVRHREHNDLETMNRSSHLEPFQLTCPNGLHSKISTPASQTLATKLLAFANNAPQPAGGDSPGTDPVWNASDKLLSGRNILNKDNKASLDQLNVIADHLTRHLPNFFSEPHPIRLYADDVIFIDKTRSIRTHSVGHYAAQIALVKAYYALNYTSNRLELLNLVKDPEESCIKIRWRIVSKPGLVRFVLTFYKYHSTELWRDAISTMFVNKEGKIYCHICDNIDVEKDTASVKKVVKNPLIDRGLHV